MIYVCKEKLQSKYNLTRTKDIVGTCQYMPMEQAQGKHGVIDARSDVYSLGLVLYELLTEKTAYSGRNIADVFKKIISYNPPSPREINSQIPEMLNKITTKAIEKQKNKRYQSAQEFANALSIYLNNINSNSVLQKKKTTWIQKHKKICIASIVFFVIAVIVGLIWNQPNAEKNVALGKKFYHGEGVEQNFQTAYELFEKARKQGSIEAEYALGVMYFRGEFVQQDVNKALELLEKAANQGSIKAQHTLGMMHYKGEGVKANIDTAFYWFEKSANQGDAESQYILGLIYIEKGGKDKFIKAREWYEKAASQDYAMV